MFKIPTDKEQLDSEEPNTKENKQQQKKRGSLKVPMRRWKAEGPAGFSEGSIPFPSVGGGEECREESAVSASLHPVRHLAFVFEEELILALRQGARLRGSPRAAAADFPTNRVPTHSSWKKIPHPSSSLMLAVDLWETFLQDFNMEDGKHRQEVRKVGHLNRRHKEETRKGCRTQGRMLEH